MPDTTTEPAEMAAALRAYASTPTAEAAVHLVVFADWHTRPAFLACLDHLPAEEGDPAAARVRWAEVMTALDAGELRAHSTAERLLRLAASLAHGHPVDLRDCLRGLGSAHTAAVVKALTHAAHG